MNKSQQNEMSSQTKCFVRFRGGLGNQLFAYAFSYMLKEKYDAEIIFDESFYDKRPGHEHAFHMFHYGSINNRCFMRYKPNTKIGRIILRALHRIKKAICIDETIVQGDSIRYIDFSITGKNVMFDGYWQNPRYFDEYRNGIVKQLQLRSVSEKVESVSRFIKDNRFCAVHIRRGDYATFYNNSILPMEYYHEAIKIQETRNPQVKFLVFSDDPDYCKKEFRGDNFSFVSDLGSFIDEEELYLMSCCNSLIIANSSFSWWGAYLSMSNNVICPQYRRWGSEFYHPDWMQIEVKEKTSPDK